MNYRNIYVVCPYGLVTGGPDALHQLVYYLNGMGLNAKLVYADIGKSNKKIPNPYSMYIDSYLLLKDIIDESESAIVVPETLIYLLDKYNNITKFIWWLSVDNNTVASGFFSKIKKVVKKLTSLSNLKKLWKIRTLKNFFHLKKYDFNDENVVHLCASYYAYDYVDKRKNNAKAKMLIEPISLYFLKTKDVKRKKEDIVLYNPSKNYKYTKEIIKTATDVNFVALRGYTQEELVELYSRAKVYIDFGSFPGAERIPKEAVLHDCIIITGTNGASAYYGDVPINAEYKIESCKSNIKKIVKKIYCCLEEYESRIDDFVEYKQTVLQLENNFLKNLKEIFG